MRWRKHGVVWRPSGERWWARSHATCPTPIWLDDGTLRVYVQCRDERNVGRVGYVDLDPLDPRKVIREAAAPVLDVGRAGAFDDNGVFQTSVVRLSDGRLYMYYVGFEICHHIRYRLLTGLAVSSDGGETFERVLTTPILDRTPGEELFRCGPWVVQDSNGFRMWYIAGNSWETLADKSVPVYDLRHAESEDGVHWPSNGVKVMSINPAQEHGIGRPVVRRLGSAYEMFYSIRWREPAAYGMGYALSDDGLSWARADSSLGLIPSAAGWDSESVEYGVDIHAAGKTWLLYNGNDFGGTGLGIAERLEGE